MCCLLSIDLIWVLQTNTTELTKTSSKSNTIERSGNGTLISPYSIHGTGELKFDFIVITGDR